MKGQELKRRILGVEETVKITKAMQMIASSKMLKSQQKFRSSKNFYQQAKELVKELVTPKNNHKLFEKSKGEKCAFVVISGDKGFCGDYNQLVLEAAYEEIQKHNTEDVIVVGKMAIDFFKKKDIEMDRSFVHLLQNPLPFDAKRIAEDIIERLLSGKVDKVFLVFTKMIGISGQRVVTKQVLPIEFDPQENDKPILYQTDKSIESRITQLLAAKIYYALCSATLAINYKTMFAMQQATSNGEEMVEQLTKQYNRKRQEAITNELADVTTSLQGRRV